VERLALHVSMADASAITVLDDVRLFANGELLRDDASVVFIGVGPT